MSSRCSWRSSAVVRRSSTSSRSAFARTAPRSTSRSRFLRSATETASWSGSPRSRAMYPLIAAQRELEIAAKRREQFLAMLSHELRNPLAAVLNATNLMEEAKFEATTVEKCHHVVGRQANHMARLLDDLLAAPPI